MSVGARVEGVYGPGSYTDQEFIPVPQDARRLLKYLAKASPGFTKDERALEDVNFHGGNLPIIPGPFKAQVLSAVLHAMIGITCKEILAMKSISTGKINIDTDHAGLYLNSPVLIDINGRSMLEMVEDGSVYKLGKDLDKNCMHANAMRNRGWAIYPTRDKDVVYQVMTIFSPYKFFSAYGLDADNPAKTNDEAYEVIKSVISTYSARELEQKNIEHGFCGQTCYSPKQWRETTMGQMQARHPVIDYSQVIGSADLPPISFPSITADPRPLAGIKVIELARVIATPALCAVLASLGAEVVKIQSPTLADPNVLQLTLTVGKYTASLDLTSETDRQTLHNLIGDADVVVQAFRLRSLERKGFGLADIVETARKRNKGIVYLDLNCYGQEGVYAERPGFQQIADAATGCSYVTGISYGRKEGDAVVPSLPISDMMAGAAGALEVLLALRDRARHGGSYHASSVLVATDTIQLTPEFGLYQPEVVQKVQDRLKFAEMGPDHGSEEMMGVVLKAWMSNSDLMTRKQYWTTFAESPFGKNYSILAPVWSFDCNTDASPYWKHSPRPYCEHDKVGWGLPL